MKTPRQLAEEAWKAIIARGVAYKAGQRADYDLECVDLIKAAIEKAVTKALQEYENNRAAFYRAARASEPWRNDGNILWMDDVGIEMKSAIDAAAIATTHNATRGGRPMDEYHLRSPVLRAQRGVSRFPNFIP